MSARTLGPVQRASPGLAGALRGVETRQGLLEPVRRSQVRVM